MAAASTNSSLFAGLPDLPHVAGTEPNRIALDAFRTAIAVQVSKSIGVDVDKVYEGIQVGAKGCDCNVALPRFKLKGDVKVLAQKAAEEFVPNEYIAKAESNGTAFVSFHFHTPTLFRLVMHQINQLNHLSEHVPEASTSVPDGESASAAAPAASSSTAAATATNGSASDVDAPKAKKAFSSKQLAHGYGTNHSGKGKTMVLDFSSPNIAKPFHAGHLRSTIIGMFIANVYTANGWDVVKLNYLGDWGKQYGLLAVGFDRYGSEEKLQEDPIKHLYDVYVKINADATKEIEEGIRAERKRLLNEGASKGEKVTILNEKKEGVELTEDMPFTRQEEEFGDRNSAIHTAARAMFKGMEDGDKGALDVWKRFRELSIKKYEEIYARLNIEFDIYWGESQVSQESQDKAVEVLVQKGIAHEDKGALLVDLQKYKLGKTPIRKRDGTNLYITRDIGGAVERFEKYNFDKAVYVVAAQQNLHFQQLFKTMELMEYPWAKNMIHINFGMVLGMSTRKGTVVFLEDILDEAKDVMHNQMASNEAKYAQIEDPEHTADVVGITAVKIQDMQGKRINNYEFNLQRMTSFEGDTGPYLQYAHVRLASVERKSAPEVVLPPHGERAERIKTDLLVEAKARDIVLQLANYPDVVKKAMETHEPSNIVTFLFKLCHSISSAWEVLLVRGQPQDVALARLWLFVSARDVLANAMRLLSLDPLERM